MSLSLIIIKQDYKIDPEIIRRLARSIEENELINPVTVTPINGNGAYELIAGLKRIKAVELLGRNCIDAIVKNIDELHKELIEIDENLVRYELSPIERGELLIKRKGIYEILHPETKHGGDRKSEGYEIKMKSFRFDIPSFTEDTAEKTGLTQRTIQHDIQIAKNLTDEAKEVVKEKGISKQSALKLARLKPTLQNNIIKKESNIDTEIDKAYKAQRMMELKKAEDIDDYTLMQRAGYEPKPFDVWTFNLIDSLSGDVNITGISPGIIFNLLYYYTKQGDTVITLNEDDTICDVCKVMKRNYSVNGSPADLVLIDLTVKKDGANKEPDIEVLFKKTKKILLKADGHIAVIIQNAESEEEGSEYIDRAFSLTLALQEANFKVMRRISAPLNTQYYQPLQINKAKKERRMLGLVRDIIVGRKC